jgi:hypothetical protein
MFVNKNIKCLITVIIAIPISVNCNVVFIHKKNKTIILFRAIDKHTTLYVHDKACRCTQLKNEGKSKRPSIAE